ncbi:50S ribosomal protein L7Ae [Candidatus Woesearchaeota archaeon]|nr:50S ribosomal protein L7Ae [Candidatus Woesearchaeota archaeon]
MEVSKDVLDKIYEAIELARSTGKIKKGINEVTKAVERGIAKLVLLASDVNPAEIIMHIEPLCKEKSIPVVKVKSREELGALSGLQRPTTTIAIIQEGEAKNILKDVISKLGK